MNRPGEAADRGATCRTDGGSTTAASDGAGNGNRVVLVVDDEAQFAESVARWLESDWEVVVATDGDEAVEKFGPHVDAVLLDRRMPSLSGDEALERIRAQDGDARVAMVTAVTPDWDVVDMEFDCYLEKPVSRQEVVDTAEELYARTGYVRELQALFSLASKIGLLRSQYPESELREDERFRRLEAELERVQGEAASSLAAVDDAAFAELLQVVSEGDGAVDLDDGLALALDGADAAGGGAVDGGESGGAVDGGESGGAVDAGEDGDVVDADEPDAE